ncbi:MAG: error-prone DNA polymerase [Alphaproteobacteria bacterium]
MGVVNFKRATDVELAVTTNFSFLRGASHPHELVERAAALGYRAIGIADRNTVAGVVRAHVAAKAAGIRLVPGCRLVTVDGIEVLAYPADRAAWGRLCRVLTLGKRRAEKGGCTLTVADLSSLENGFAGIVVPPENFSEESVLLISKIKLLNTIFDVSLHVMASPRCDGHDGERLARAVHLADAAGIGLVAAGDVLMHVPERRPLLDVLTCIREKCTLATAGTHLAANGERHLKAPEAMARLFAARPDALAASGEIAQRLTFSLDDLAYEYPREPVPAGRSPDSQLARLALKGARKYYPKGVPAKVRTQIGHELRIIHELGYAPYFLTVHDIVGFARGKGILCQGRGSAANSAVCYCLGVTAVDPERLDLLFERFVSAARREPPDIDVDFEHERREEVIQHIYARYGRERAGLAATVIRYRTRSAVREVGKVLGLSEDTATALVRGVWGRSSRGLNNSQTRDAGLDHAALPIAQLLALTRELIGFPRHLSQHVGGFVITEGRLDEVVPIENAAMEDRTVIEWDKDDLDALNILKIDVLALGMLSCLRRAFDLIATHHGRRLDLATLPAEDPAVYDMLCRADSIGVFQVESRAQMSMLPRLKPRCFYDLVIEVAIVRPGPIQGDMVHPYLRRRDGREAVSFPSPELRAVLDKTFGVPLFQEQAMRIAIVAAGFTPEDADRLRRSMASFRNMGTVSRFHDQMVEGMVERGYKRDFAERCFRQIEGFGDYGFPESHAASFALLVYASAWIKCHYPDVFAAALLNSQPMGFYAPAQIVRDAREHGVEVRPVDVNASEWDCTLETASAQMTLAPVQLKALRLGFRQIKGMSEDAAERLVAARALDGPFCDVDDLAARTHLAKAVLARLARADAFTSMTLTRRPALWAVTGLDDAVPLPLFAAAAISRSNGGPGIEAPEPAPPLPVLGPGEAVAEDYRMLRLSLRDHPARLLRPRLDALGFRPCRDLAASPHRGWIRLAGLVLVRQRPGTASGVIFMTVEDEDAIANIVVWPKTFERYRREVMGARLVGVAGRAEHEGSAPHRVTHVIAERLYDLSEWLDSLDEGGEPIAVPSHDFH